MAQATGRSAGKEAETSQQVFRHWVEVREVSSGSVRSLPLTESTLICLSRKKNQAPLPNKQVLRLGDGDVTLEAESLDDLAAQLRQKYPDGAYERTLHRERDHEAEKRRADALNGFTNLIVESFVRCLSAEDAVAFHASLKTKEGRKAFAEAWPTIVDAYFHAVCNPKR